jgi:hypothetical protein
LCTLHVGFFRSVMQFILGLATNSVQYLQ